MESHVSSGGLCRHVVHLREAKVATARGTPGLGLAPTKGLGPSPAEGGPCPCRLPPSTGEAGVPVLEAPNARGESGTGEHWARPRPSPSTPAQPSDTLAPPEALSVHPLLPNNTRSSGPKRSSGGLGGGW